MISSSHGSEQKELVHKGKLSPGTVHEVFNSIERDSTTWYRVLYSTQAFYTNNIGAFVLSDCTVYTVHDAVCNSGHSITNTDNMAAFLLSCCSLYSVHCTSLQNPQSLKLERKKLRKANQTLAMILHLLRIVSKDGVLLSTRFNVTQIYPVIVALHVRWFSLNETRFP